MASPQLAYQAAAGEGILNLIGNTPLIRLRRITGGLRAGVEVHAKAEWFNPGGSVKDRPALAMIHDGERRGKLGPGKIILDATSGNTGIAYAMIGAIRGYRVRLCMAAGVSPERQAILRAYGADIVLTDAAEGSDGAIRKARELYAESPNTYFYPDQYSNQANAMAHYWSTGREILRQVGARVTHFVAGLGTSGTFMGVGRRLREHDPDIKLVSVQPDSWLHGIEGLKHMETAMVPAIYSPGFADRNIGVSTDEAHETVCRLAREEGLFVGISSGAVAAAALKVASELEAGVVVTVFPDSGFKYLSNLRW